jgi:AcrR family transcriptional regulator
VTKREQILNKSLQLFAEKGIQATPMSLIVAESGVATGTIYHHFKSKQEIIEALYLDFKIELGKAFHHSHKQEETSFEQFKGIWRGVFNFYLNQPLKFRFSQQVTHSHYIDEELKKEGLNHYQVFFDFFKAGMKRGEFVQMDLQLALELIHSSVVCLAKLQLEEKIDQLETSIQEAMQFAWRGITNEKIKSL